MGRPDGKPKGKMSAYAYFVQTCREEHKKKHPNETVVFTEFSKKCAERWKTMSEKEKKRFQDMAVRDKARYEGEMKHYIPVDGGKKGGKRKKDPNAPKRSMSAFFWFGNDARPDIRKVHPEWPVGDVAKELGRRWALFTPQDKLKYEEMAKKDKARYEREMKDYKAGKSSPKKAVAVAMDEDDDDDDEDE